MSQVCWLLVVTVLAVNIRGRGPGTLSPLLLLFSALLCRCCSLLPLQQSVMCDYQISCNPTALPLANGFSTLKKADSGPPRSCRQRSARDGHYSTRRETYSVSLVVEPNLVGVSTPCGAVSFFLDLYMHRRIYYPGMEPYPPRVALAHSGAMAEIIPVRY